MSSFTFQGEPTRLDMIHNTLAPLNPKLLANDLYEILKKNNKKDDLVELGYVYYTAYYKPNFETLARPTSSSLLELYSRAQPGNTSQPIPTFVQMTDHSTPAHEACNISYSNSFAMNPTEFIAALRNIHPFEIMGNYYHDPKICDSDFSSILTRLSNTLVSYFDHGNVIILRNFLSGIKKCICLRVLSNNAYYYGHEPDANELLSDDPAMKQLVRFYVISDLIHDRSIERYNSHLHMIRKYNELSIFIESVLSVAPTILSDNDFRFDSILEIHGRLMFIVFDRVFRENRHFVFNAFPEFINDPVRKAYIKRYKEKTKRRFQRIIKTSIMQMNQVNDLLHDLQLHYHDNDEDVVKRGIHHLKLVLNNLNEKKITLTKSIYNDLYKIYELTFGAFKKLPSGLKKDYDETMFEIMEKMDQINNRHRRFRQSKRSGGSKKNKNKNKNKNKMLKRRTKKHINV